MTLAADTATLAGGAAAEAALEAPARGAAGAGLWTVGGRLAARLVDVFTLLVLVRLLPPADFGLVAMGATILQTVEAVLELPLAQALIRMPSPSASMYATALTLGILRGAAIAALMTALAWPAAHFFSEPRLVPLILAMAFAPICRGLVSPRMAVFMRGMDFRREAALDIAGKLAAFLVAVSVALATGSYWAIAAGTIAAPVAAAALSYGFAPMRPRFTLKGWPHFADMLGWNSLAQLIAAVNWQADRIVLGRFVPTATFGRFAISDTLAALPFQALIEPLTRPLLVSFSSARSSAELGRAYLATTGVIVLLIAPIYAMMALFSGPIILIALGGSWKDASPILTAIACAAALQLPLHPFTSFAMSQNRTRLVAFRFLAELIVRLPLSLVGIAYLGVVGAVAGRAGGSLAALVYLATTIHRVGAVSAGAFLLHLVRYALPILAGSAAALGVRLSLPEARSVFEAIEALLMGGAAFLTCYAATIVLVRLQTDEASAEARILDVAFKIFRRLAGRSGKAT